MEAELGSNRLYQACDKRMRLHRILLRTVHTEEVTGSIPVSPCTNTWRLTVNLPLCTYHERCQLPPPVPMGSGVNRIRNAARRVRTVLSIDLPVRLAIPSRCPLNLEVFVSAILADGRVDEILYGVYGICLPKADGSRAGGI